MEMKINSNRVKQLRNQRSWSQDQLASVSGLSLRTIQRIENLSTCSLDSKRALAAVFEVDIDELTLNEQRSVLAERNWKGRSYGYAGTTLGVLSAFVAIAWSLMNGYISYEAAGIHFGIVGVIGGVSCAAIAVLSNKFFACCSTGCCRG